MPLSGKEKNRQSPTLLPLKIPIILDIAFQTLVGYVSTNLQPADYKLLDNVKNMLDAVKVNITSISLYCIVNKFRPYYTITPVPAGNEIIFYTCRL